MELAQHQPNPAEPLLGEGPQHPLFLPAWKVAAFKIPDLRGTPVTEILSIAVSDEAGLVAVCTRAALYLLDTGSIQNGNVLMPRNVAGDMCFPEGLSFSPDGTYLCGGFGPLYGNCCETNRGNFGVFRTGDLVDNANTLPAAQLHVEGAPHVSTWSPDGSLLAVGSLGSETTVYDVSGLPEGRAPRKITSFSRGKSGGWVMSLSFSPDSQALIVCYFDGVIKFVSLRDEEAVRHQLTNDPRPSLSSEDRDVLQFGVVLPPLPEQTTWWQRLAKVPRALLALGTSRGSKKLRRLRNLQGSLSADGTMLAISGEGGSSSYLRSRPKDRWYCDSAIKVLDLTRLDPYGQPIMEELVSYPLNQEIHSVQFLGDGRHILVATQGCFYEDINRPQIYECPHLAVANPGEDKDRQAQLRVLELKPKQDGLDLAEVTTLVQNCTWLKAAASRSARTICAGAYDGYGYVFQRKG